MFVIALLAALAAIVLANVVVALLPFGERATTY